MNELLFSNYSVKGQLKFYKNEPERKDEDEKITVNISIGANHKIDENIYNDLSAFLEKLLIADYMTEQMYASKKAHEKVMLQAEKQRKKQEKENEKERKKARIANNKAKSVKKSSY
jgi:sorbitol-specific phosphotransferase system component IIBC